MPGNDGYLELSPEHGLNPTLETCFFCGEETGAIALLGRIGDGDGKDDIEAPMHSVLGYEPCEKCKQRFSQGILLVEAAREPLVPGQPEIAPGAYPTGRHMVVTEAAVPLIVSGDELIESILDKRMALVDMMAFEMILGAEEKDS